MHIYPWQIDPPSHLSIDALNTTTPNLADLLAELPLQSTIDPWKTITLNQFPDRLTPPPTPIDHRSMDDHYTTSVSHIASCTDTLGRLMGHNGVPWIYG